MMDWIPLAFIAFKVVVFGAGMFFAIKWHYDQDQQAWSLRTLLRTGAVLATVFLFSAVGLVYATFSFARWLGMDLYLP